MVKILILCMMFVGYVVSATADERCTCGQAIELSEQIKVSSKIFTGRVSAIVPIDPDDYVVKFIVYDAWKGVDKPETVVFSTKSRTECGFDFHVGHEYLVYAVSNRNEGTKDRGKPSTVSNGSFDSVSRCGASKQMAEVLKSEYDVLGKPIHVDKVK